MSFMQEKRDGHCRRKHGLQAVSARTTQGKNSKPVNMEIKPDKARIGTGAGDREMSVRL